MMPGQLFNVSWLFACMSTPGNTHSCLHAHRHILSIQGAAFHNACAHDAGCRTSQACVHVQCKLLVPRGICVATDLPHDLWTCLESGHTCKNMYVAYVTSSESARFDTGHWSSQYTLMAT